MKKTNAMRILEQQGIEYEVVTYEYQDDHLDALTAADSAKLPPEQVYKTIVMQDNANEVFVFCIPAELSVSLKRARALTGSKSITPLKLDSLQRVTGYVRGGCSPLGMKKAFTTFVEELSLLEEKIYISAGVRGVQLQLRPTELVAALGASFANCT